jgi:purine-nucleoside phosphorylase
VSAVDHHLEYELAARAAEHLRNAGFSDAVVAIQTGSGIPMPGLDAATTIRWSEIPGFPEATAPGHAGALHLGTLRGARVIVMQGRLHSYEGHAPAEIIRPVRALGLLGVRNLVLTNATGGVREEWGPGTVVRISDHVNMMGFDPLGGLHDPRFGDRFPVTAGRAHDAGLAELAHTAADELGITLESGVYCGVTGPSFETPAEVARMRLYGIDVVGMSTVPEVLAANQLGLRTLVLSLVANPAGVVAEGATAEEEVLEVAGRTGRALMDVVERVVERLSA